MEIGEYAYQSLFENSGDYEDPSIEELAELCISYGLINDIRIEKGRFRFTAVNRYFDLDRIQADLLIQGLLLGYFSVHSGDELTMAAWE